jgi:hypothetical protein
MTARQISDAFLGKSPFDPQPLRWDFFGCTVHRQTGVFDKSELYLLSPVVR